MLLAHQFAMESPLVQAEAVSAGEFYSLSDQYEVSSVPHTVVLDANGTQIASYVGGVPEAMVLVELKKALAN